MAYTPPQNITSSVDMFTWFSSTVDNWLFPGIILVVFLIILVRQLFNPNTSFPKALASAAFPAMILSVLARILGFVDTIFMIIFIVITAIAAVLMHMENN